MDKARLRRELDENWEVLAEPIQTVMRMYGVRGAYEKLKELTRGQKIDRGVLTEFVDKLDIPKEAKQRLIKLRPEGYTGIAEKLV